MIKYAVWSTQVEQRTHPPRGEPRPKREEPEAPAVDVLETTRTAMKVAEDDAQLINERLSLL
jgi:hypothetical protein